LGRNLASSQEFNPSGWSGKVKSDDAQTDFDIFSSGVAVALGGLSRPDDLRVGGGASNAAAVQW
jgi:hypothetical protein